MNKPVYYRSQFFALNITKCFLMNRKRNIKYKPRFGNSWVLKQKNEKRNEVILTSFLFLKRIYLVLDAFKVSLFALNQSSILESSKFAKSYKSCKLFEESCSVVSWAKKIVKNFEDGTSMTGRNFAIMDIERFISLFCLDYRYF